MDRFLGHQNWHSFHRYWFSMEWCEYVVATTNEDSTVAALVAVAAALLAGAAAFLAGAAAPAVDAAVEAAMDSSSMACNRRSRGPIRILRILSRRRRRRRHHY